MLTRLFQPHLRLVYAFSLALLISDIAHLPLLYGANALLLPYFVYRLAQLPNKKRKFYYRTWLSLALLAQAMLASMSWQLNENGWQYYAQGTHQAWLVILRMHLISLLIWLLCLPLSEIQLLQGIQRLPLPAKLIQLFVLTLRYISLLKQSKERIETAMRARGYQFKADRRSWSVLAQLVVLLLIHAMQQAEKSEMALKARAFQLRSKQSKAHMLRQWLIFILLISLLFFLKFMFQSFYKGEL